MIPTDNLEQISVWLALTDVTRGLAYVAASMSGLLFPPRIHLTFIPRPSLCLSHLSLQSPGHGWALLTLANLKNEILIPSLHQWEIWNINHRVQLHHSTLSAHPDPQISTASSWLRDRRRLMDLGVSWSWPLTPTFLIPGTCLSQKTFGVS